MSQENVEMIRTIYAQGLLDTVPGPDALAGAEIEYVNPPDAIDSGVRHGGHEFQTALQGLADAFDQRKHRLRRLFDGGDSVVAEVTFYGRGAGSGANVEQQEVHTWTFRDGWLVRFEWGRDLAAALKAVGLEEYAVSENLDVVRSILASWERGDFSSAEWADPEVEWAFADGPEPGTWRGISGMAKAHREWLGAWEDLHIVAEEYRELDDERVLVLVHLTGRGKMSGLEIGQVQAKGADLFHVQGGKVTRLVLYLDPEKALADLGLEE